MSDFRKQCRQLAVAKGASALLLVAFSGGRFSLFL